MELLLGECEGDDVRLCNFLDACGSSSGRIEVSLIQFQGDDR